ncbi:MAG: hypothetical protein NC123_07730 [Butyrivibrio sp.]|nr:hypothetical protein [Acetatifactor muris]MCM1559421.1 hypothetical protein [Butyrivibrio sp.]
MKKMIKRIGALALGAVILGSSSMAVCAGEENYTYNYDWWGDVQGSPDFYTVIGVFTSADLGLDKNLSAPQGLFVTGNLIYLCDTGNNRILELERVGEDTLEVRRIIDEFKGDVEVTTFSSPTDIAVSEEGAFFIADRGNARILKLDKDLNYLMQFDKPVDSTLDPEAAFQPSKIAIDTADRVYCVAGGINKGLIKYERDGEFSGFIGATKVRFNWTDYIWKKLATQAQRERMESFVPTEYDNLYMDYEGFIYVVEGEQIEEDLKDNVDSAVRRLNLLGNDILVRNGEWPVYGDLYMGSGGGYEGPSSFKDVTAMDNDVYVCLDEKRGRLFGYNDQGRMLFACGGSGNMDGYFKMPSALDHMGADLLVLDSMDCSLTLLSPTNFGSLVYRAMDQFNAGEYEASGETWQEVMKLNGNYDLAYIGIGRALLSQEKYGEALDYFELKYDADNYSKAYKQYRKEWVEDHIAVIVVVILALFLIPMSIGKVKAIKHEIDIADIFRR